MYHVAYDIHYSQDMKNKASDQDSNNESKMEEELRRVLGNDAFEEYLSLISQLIFCEYAI